MGRICWGGWVSEGVFGWLLVGVLARCRLGIWSGLLSGFYGRGREGRTRTRSKSWFVT